MNLGVKRILLALTAALAVTACSKGDPQLMNVRSTTQGPDEFGILPTKPLELPKSYAELPEPTPGAANLTDPTPDADAIAALGGNPKLLGRTGVPAGDRGIVAHGTRFGIAANIRETLAAEDLEYRRKNDGRLLERVFNVNVYFKAYAKQSLDQFGELEYWRARGVRTVAAPPEPER